MAWGFEWFAELDVFSIGAVEAITLLVFFTLFDYIVERGISEKPLEDTLQIMAYYFLFLFIMHLLAVPSLIVGLLSIEVYLLLIKYFSKMNMHKLIVLHGYLWTLLSIIALMPDSIRLYLTWFILAFQFALSQFRLNNKAKESAKK